MAKRSHDSRAVRASDDLSIPGLIEFVKTYAQQETIGPLKGAGRWLGMGAAGAVLIGFGAALLLLGILRLIQAELGSLSSGGWSWVPYLIVLVLTAGGIAVAVSRINRASLHKAGLNEASINRANLNRDGE